jgi:ABC-type amino acid transport substrate-binding protein
MKPESLLLACAVALCAAMLAGPPARAQTAAELSQEFAKPHPLPIPSPWPMRHLVKPGSLTVAITAKTPPESFTTPSGEYDGSKVALFRKIAQDLGLKIDFVRLDWPGVLPGLVANRFDMACEGALWNNDRLTSGQFLLTRPVNVSGVVAIVRADSGIKTFSDVNGHVLGGVKGEDELAAAEKAVKASSVLALPGRPEGLLAVLNKQVDAFALSVSTAKVLVEQSPRKNELAIIGPVLDMVPQSLCVNANEADLLEAVNILLTNYRVDGTLAAFETKYGGSAEDVDLLSSIGY